MIWETFKKHINSIPKGQTVTRTVLKAIASENPDRPGTVDTYRRMCELSGYLKKGSHPGIYIKVRDIPENACKNDIKEEAYGYRNHTSNYSTRDWYDNDKVIWEGE